MFLSILLKRSYQETISVLQSVFTQQEEKSDFESSLDSSCHNYQSQQVFHVKELKWGGNWNFYGQITSEIRTFVLSGDSFNKRLLNKRKYSSLLLLVVKFNFKLEYLNFGINKFSPYKGFDAFSSMLKVLVLAGQVTCLLMFTLQYSVFELQMSFCWWYLFRGASVVLNTSIAWLLDENWGWWQDDRIIIILITTSLLTFYTKYKSTLHLTNLTNPCSLILLISNINQ